MLLLHHAYFRTVHQNPTSSNIIRQGKRINYIDAKGTASVEKAEEVQPMECLSAKESHEFVMFGLV